MKGILLGLGMGLLVGGLRAQTMPDMPGMKMPGMKMEAPVQVQKPSAGVVKQQSGDAAAAKAAASVEGSVAQQARDPQTKPGDTPGLTVPVQALQEPEAVGFRTGTDTPAPELLGGVVDLPAMGVEEFIGLAEKGNPTLSQARANVERSRQQARQAGLPPDPLFGYSGDHIRGGEYGGGEEGAFFSQEFVLGHKLALRRDVYRAEGRANEFGVAMQVARVHNDVGRAFLHALAAQQTVVVRDRLLKVALDADTNAHELERVGQADASDMLNAEIAAEQAKVEFVEAQRGFLSAFQQLATFAGQAGLAAHPLRGELAAPPEIDAEAMVGADAAESPAVKQAEAQVGVAEARVKAAEREKVPNLEVKAGEWKSGEHLSGLQKGAGPESFVEAGVQLPLWNRNQGNVEAAKVLLERARQDVVRVRLGTRNRAAPYAQMYLAAKYSAAKYRQEMLPRARRAYELEVTKYQQMGQAYPHVLTAQKMLFTLQLAYIQALHEQWGAAIALENFTLMDGLNVPVGVGSDGTMMNLPAGGSAE